MSTTLNTAGTQDLEAALTASTPDWQTVQAEVLGGEWKAYFSTRLETTEGSLPVGVVFTDL